MSKELKISKKQLKELTTRLDTIIKLTAMNSLQGKSLTEKIEILSELGLQNKEIALLVGTTAGYVNTAKQRLKKTKGKTKGKQKGSKNIPDEKERRLSKDDE